MSYPIEKYKYFIYKDQTTGSKTISAVSSYAGRAVKGYAKCNPIDNFSEEKGKELAAARCNVKVCDKRKIRAKAKLDQAYADFRRAEDRFQAMRSFYQDAFNTANEAADELSNLMKQM